MSSGGMLKSARIDTTKGSKKQKAKKQIPTLALLKSAKTYQPVQLFVPWNNDESNQFKISQKPLFSDDQMSPKYTEKYPNSNRITVTEGNVVENEFPVSILNPGVDPQFSSAMFLVCSKDNEFYQNIGFSIFPTEINPSGRYVAKLFDNLHPVRVIFDDKIPVNEEGEELCIKHSNPKILLLTFLHKAFMKYSQLQYYNALDIVTILTGLVHFEVELSFINLSTWYNRSEVLAALYIKKESESTLGQDQLFVILDCVDLDVHRKFVKLQCPGAAWRGRFSGFEEDQKHWTNQIRVLLEIDPEGAQVAPFFWMIFDDVKENFDSIQIFQFPSTFSSKIEKNDQWNPKESQFYYGNNPFILKADGMGEFYYYISALPVSVDSNLQMKIRDFRKENPKVEPIVNTTINRWEFNTINNTRNSLYEFTMNCKGGYYFAAFSSDLSLSLGDFNDFCPSLSFEGDLPFYVSLEEYANNLFSQRFELIGRVFFNFDIPVNLSYSLFLSNFEHDPYVCCLLVNNDTNEFFPSDKLRQNTLALNPNQRGYSLAIFGLYNDLVNRLSQLDLVGRWRLKLFSDSPINEFSNFLFPVYNDVEGECNSLDETHIFIQYVLTGSCDAFIVLETNHSLSLTLTSNEDERELNSMRGSGFVFLPLCKIPGEKEQKRFILKGIITETVPLFSWKLRIFSNAPVNVKEDTSAAEKISAIIAAWEKKRPAKPVAKKTDPKGKPGDITSFMCDVYDDLLEIEEGDAKVYEEDQVEAFFKIQPEEPAPESQSLEIGEEIKEKITHASTVIQDDWDEFEAARLQVGKLYTPPETKSD